MTRIAVVGAGLIGKMHIAAIAAAEKAELCAIIDPFIPAGSADVPVFPGPEEYLKNGSCDGAIIATPNALHFEHALAFIEAGIPVLVEKPLTTDAESALRLVEAAESRNLPILTGHHRRHNPIILEAKRIIEEGGLGKIITVQTTCWFHKPADYFKQDWRRRPGAGPVFINLIHDLDLMRHLCGEIESISAFESSLARGFEVEDTAAILLRFATGALGTVTVSDTVAAPWSWEMTSGENPAFPFTGKSCYRIGGTEASLSLPDLTLWKHENGPDWWTPISGRKIQTGSADPLVLQIQDFVAVIKGQKKPLVSGRDGYESLRIIEAIKKSATKENKPI